MTRFHPLQTLFKALHDARSLHRGERSPIIATAATVVAEGHNEAHFAIPTVQRQDLIIQRLRHELEHSHERWRDHAQSDSVSMLDLRTRHTAAPVTSGNVGANRPLLANAIHYELVFFASSTNGAPSRFAQHSEMIVEEIDGFEGTTFLQVHLASAPLPNSRAHAGIPRTHGIFAFDTRYPERADGLDAKEMHAFEACVDNTIHRYVEALRQLKGLNHDWTFHVQPQNLFHAAGQSALPTPLTVGAGAAFSAHPTTHSQTTDTEAMDAISVSTSVDRLREASSVMIGTRPSLAYDLHASRQRTMIETTICPPMA